MLPSVIGTNARHYLPRQNNRKHPGDRARNQMRTKTGGSKNQSIARVIQNAAPNHARLSAIPSAQTYRRTRRRRAQQRLNVGNKLWAIGYIIYFSFCPIMHFAI